MKEKEKKQNFWQDDRGVGVIEIVLILVILIGLVLVFKEQITAIINNAFTATKKTEAYYYGKYCTDNPRCNLGIIK